MRLGLLTSGGDCAGLNAAIRAVGRRAILHYGWTVLGVTHGTRGLMEHPVEVRELRLPELGSPLLREGGTMLKTVTSGDPFAWPLPGGGTEDRSARIVDGLRELDVGALIVIGGDGSLRILRRLAEERGIKLVFIPKTIDNDVPQAGHCIGYETALVAATEALDRLHATALAQDRIMILEVMGRDAGHIALGAGIAGGADAILIPEIAFRTDELAAHIARVGEREGRQGAVIVIAEGARFEGTGHAGARLAARLATLAGHDARVTVLGYLQRGGTPVAADRIIASALGTAAVDLVAEGQFGRMVAWRGDRVETVDIATIPLEPGGVDRTGDLVRTAQGLGIYIGNPGE